MEKLLIDYLDEASSYMQGKREALHKLETQYRKIYDPDLVREMKALRREMGKKRTEIRAQLLLNLEEFRALRRYYPELLSAFMEDEYIGSVLAGKAWLLDFKPAPANIAAARLQEIRGWRMQLRAAKASLRGWVGVVRAKPFLSNYPLLRPFVQGDMDKKDVLLAIENLDTSLRKEGWLVLLSDSLIKIPLAKFMNMIIGLNYEEHKAKEDFAKMRGKGTVAETRALRAVEEIEVKKNHYESIIAQILLSNPEYLSGLKKQKSWLSRGKPDPIIKFAQNVTPHKIKERAWLNQMRARIEEAK